MCKLYFPSNLLAEVQSSSRDNPSETGKFVKFPHQEIDYNLNREKNPPQNNSRDIVRLYLRDIGRIPLLSKDEEIQLARQISDYHELLKIREDYQDDPHIRRYIEVMESYDSFVNPSNSRSDLEKWLGKVNLTVKQLQRIISQGKSKWAKLANLPVEDLQVIEQKAIKAKRKMINANLLLVVSIAKRYQNRGLDLLDLIQEGTLGLERAVEKFDHTKGYHFSTYAYWWIRQGMTRAIATQSRNIRLPIHITEKLNQLKKVQRELSQSLGRIATIAEVAHAMKMELAELRKFINQIPRSVSLELKVGEDYNTELIELIEAKSATPEENLMKVSLRQDIQKMLACLNAKEQQILRLRYGFEDGKIYSLSDTARIMNLSRERIRQIQAKAINKLRQPDHQERIRGYLESMT